MLDARNHPQVLDALQEEIKRIEQPAGDVAPGRTQRNEAGRE